MKSVTIQVMFDAEHDPVLLVTSLRDGEINREEFTGFENNRDRVERHMGDIVEQIILDEYRRLKECQDK